MTTFSAPDKNPKAAASTQLQLIQPIAITGGQDLPLSVTVFDGLVPRQGMIEGGFTAYNDTQGLAWKNIHAWTADLTHTVANGLAGEGIDSGNLSMIAAGMLLDFAVKAWYATADLSSSNAHQLGKLELDVPASGPANEDEVWHFSHTNSILDNWDYTVKYQITRSPIAA